MPRSTSFLFSIEGIEGCGKSTLIEKLKAQLPTLYPNKAFHFFREPGATSWGEHIRSILLNASLQRCPLAEVYLFLSARAELNEQHLKPLLAKEHQIVILDRYYDSTFVYQGFAQNLDVTYLKQLHQSSSLNLHPHKTFYLKISPQTSISRQKVRNQNKDYFEQWGMERTTKLVEGFNQLSTQESSRFCVIDAEKSTEHVLFETLKNMGQILH
jgi:dTMP kinase